jgi:parallel beta-helix repeat protein
MTLTGRDGAKRTMLPLYKKLMHIFYSIMIISILFSIIYIISSSAEATVLHVDDDNTQGPWNGTIIHPFQHIQDAVDAAQNGTTIAVSAGTYSETILIQKNLIILGEQRETTIIQGDSNGHVMYVRGSAGHLLSTELSSLTIRNAQGLGYDCIALSYVNSGSITDSLLTNSAQSDGIQLDHCSGITIANNQINNNNGAGISLTLSENNSITNNVIQQNQKGIYIYFTSNDNTIRDNQINDNSQYGIYIVQSSDNYLYRNDFSNNGQNAQDSSTNMWSYAGEGNYWDDYNNYDQDPLDGIGDVPYSIPGASNQDMYPLGYFLEVDPPQSGNNAPTAYMPTVYPSSINFEDYVSFSGGGKDTDGYIVAYYWRSSIDGFINDEKSFSSNELSIGTHQIYFKVRDNDGEWSTEKSTYITVSNNVNKAPIALIIYVKPEAVYNGEMVYFKGEGIDTDGTITNYKWESNIDGLLGELETFSLNTLSTGTHTISFRVQDDRGEWSKVIKRTVNILYSPDSSEIVVNTGGPYIRDTFKVKFNASESRGGTEYFWEFGDGTFGSSITTTHVYPSPGNYSVKLTIRNDEGNFSSATTYVNISESASLNDSQKSIDALLFDIPVELIIMIQVIIVIVCIGFFFLWMKYK